MATMRILIAALAVALTMASAHAQGMGGFGGGRKQQHEKTTKTDTAKPKADDKAYNAALKGLPDKQFDPWHGVR